jgi:hypothetical protein
MERVVQEAIEIKLHLDSVSIKERFKLSKGWNPNTTLFRHSNLDRSGKFHEDKHKEEHCTKKSE